MKKLIATLGLVSFGLGFGGVFGENVYTDGTTDVRVCVMPERIASVDLPCDVQAIYFSQEIQAEIKPKAPRTVIFGLMDKKKEGSLTAVCKDVSYTFIIKSDPKCDNHKVLIDKRFTVKKDVDEATFNKEYVLNQARGLLKGMINGEAVRGYEIKKFNKEVIINDDDYLRAKFNTVYVGGNLIGFVGRIKNYSNYVDKVVNVKKLMQKGYILLYVKGLEDESIKLSPKEEREIFIVAINGVSEIPYLEGKGYGEIYKTNE